MNLTPKQKDRLNKAALASRARKQKRVELYSTNPSLCSCCQKPLDYDKRKNKFCSQSCAASVNNLGKTKNYTNGRYCQKKCLHCGKASGYNKFCNQECRQQLRLSQIKETGVVTGTQLTIKNIVKNLNGERCEICGLTEWQGSVIPLVLDHINGKPSDSRLDNLRLVCGNCNMQLPTFAGKNKGKGGGRPYRRLRYQQGLSF
jgi:hypothetical protein